MRRACDIYFFSVAMFRPKIWLILLIVAAAFVWFGRPTYRGWKERRYLARAKEYLEKRDFANAILSGQQAVQANPKSVEAARFMAEFCELVRSPNAIGWYERLADLEPGVFDDKIKVVYLALRSQQFAKADEMLRRAGPREQATGFYHQAAAATAISTNNLIAGEKHLVEAVRLDPTNDMHALNLGVFHLGSSQSNIVAEGRRTLEKIPANSPRRGQALRALISDSVRQKNFPRAIEFSNELISNPASGFEDRTAHLSLLKSSKSPEFDAFLQATRAQAILKAEDVFALGHWMLLNEGGEKALAWLNSLPPAIQTQQPVPMIVADCSVAVKKWSALESLLKNKNWENMEYVRHGFLARALRELKQAEASNAEWQKAVASAGGRLEALTGLNTMATNWKWDKEREELLWTIFKKFPSEQWTLRPLHDSYLARKNTQGLFAVLNAMVEIDSKNFIAKNNLAMISLLLSTRVSQAHALARDAYSQAPMMPAVAATYAYSLHLQGKTAEGLKVLEKLNQEQLSDPSVAAYYGVLLAATGDNVKAKKYLALTDKSKLLPEEQAMLARVTMGL